MDRKAQHIEFALEGQASSHSEKDPRFHYEPLMAPHPGDDLNLEVEFLGKKMGAPLWISSMTGGTERASRINRHLAQVCGEFKLGMGLGSCRPLLRDDSSFEDFNLRPLLGDDCPFYANLGIAQVEEMVESGAVPRLQEMVERLQADGLIVHVNPLQEWVQPEGDRLKKAPLETLKRLLDQVTFPLIVKEVGQGMGPKSLKELFKLPLAAIEFAAWGGTNFTWIELQRGHGPHWMEQKEWYAPLTRIGHTAEEMVNITNGILQELGAGALCQQVVISGGMDSFLDGHYLMNKLGCKSVYGQASRFLQYAQVSSELLRSYVEAQMKGLKLARSWLEVHG